MRSNTVSDLFEKLFEQGYVGYSKSRRAADAEEENRFPSSIAAKKLGVSSTVLKDVLEPSEWHHTSSYYNPTDYYDIDIFINPDDYDEDEQRKAKEQLDRMKELSKTKSKKGDEVYDDVYVRWVEWSGSRRRPKRDDVEYKNVKIIDKGGSMVDVYLPSGQVIKKKKDSKWFEAKDKNGKQLFSGGYAL